MEIPALLLGFLLHFNSPDTSIIPHYQPDIFRDSLRMRRMEAAFSAVDRMYRKEVETEKIPGFAYGIVADGKLIHTGFVGTNNQKSKPAVTANSVFRIASMSKSFAALAILKLRDAGKLQLDDPVIKYIPELSNQPSLTTDAPPITIRNLVSHTAGFPEDNPWGDRQLQDTDKEFTDFLRGGISLSNIPSQSYEYSNLGFTMLGLIITRTSGKHYEQYITEEIFKPLRMNQTYWEYEKVPADLLVHGYRLVNNEWQEEEMLHAGAYGVMGGMLTSIEDFAKYINLHLAAWPARSDPDSGPVKRSTIREMHRPGPISNLNAYARKLNGEICPRISSYNFGLGWAKDCTGKESLGHSGGLPGFGSHWAFLPQYGIAVVSFSSLTYAATSGLNIAVLDTIVSIADLQPRKILPSDILEERKLELLKFLPDWKDAEKNAIFSENFFADFFIDSLRKDAQKLFTKAGKILRAGKMVPENQLRGYCILEGEKIDIGIRFTLSPENPAKIQHFEIWEQQATTAAFRKYKLKTVSDREEYRESVKKDPAQELVALDKFIPDIVLDIRYATNNNLMREPVYNFPAAYMRRPAAAALKKIQAELKKKGLGLKIYDGYRPYSVTVKFYETFRDTAFVASPYSGSRHNRGCAVDLTIINLKTGKEIEMPTPYDAFTKEAAANSPAITGTPLKNRELLKKLMTENGFDIYPDEWWHYDFKGWKNFPVMDIVFNKLN